jgi:hypothetical protein
VALGALNRAFGFEVMARDADLVRHFLVPAVNDTDLGLVAVEAVIMYTRLVLPMLEPKFHDPHFEIDVFSAAIFGWLCQNRGETCQSNYQSGHQQRANFHDPISFGQQISSNDSNVVAIYCCRENVISVPAM